MANEISEAKKGLAAALSGIDGLRVFDYTPDSLHEFPAAIVHLESRDSVGTLGGAPSEAACAWKCSSPPLTLDRQPRRLTHSWSRRAHKA